jgi:hypothetical protein
MVLSASSKYFEKLFLEHHMESTCSPGPMIVIMRDTSFEDLSCIIEFMYKGEINISRVWLIIQNLRKFMAQKMIKNECRNN